MSERSDHPLYFTWKNMRKRCLCKTDPLYKYYGARGITICIEWDDFWIFVMDMGERPSGMSLDRENNDGNYEPSNCRWADATTQNRNTSLAKKITYSGETHCIAEWGEILGMTPSCISRRIKKYGIPVLHQRSQP